MTGTARLPQRITSNSMIPIFLIYLNGLHVYCLKIQSFDLRQIDDFKQALHRTFLLIVTFISLSGNMVYQTIDGWKNILKVRYEPDTLYKRVEIAQLGIQIGKVGRRVARRASSHRNRSMDVILVPVNYQQWCTVFCQMEKMNDVIHSHGPCMEHRDKRLACKFFLAANGLLSFARLP